MSPKTTLSTLAALAALGVVAVGQGALAQTTGVVSVNVKYADLDLSTKAGAQVALKRIWHAAKVACEQGTRTPLEYAYEYPFCVRHSADRAVASLDNPIVAAMNPGHGQHATVVAATGR